MRRLPREAATNRATVKGPESEGECRQSGVFVCSGRGRDSKYVNRLRYEGIVAAGRGLLESGISGMRGLLNSSMVNPSETFVIPITGGSPLLTNSYWPGGK